MVEARTNANRMKDLKPISFKAINENQIFTHGNISSFIAYNIEYDLTHVKSLAIRNVQVAYFFFLPKLILSFMYTHFEFMYEI